MVQMGNISYVGSLEVQAIFCHKIRLVKVAKYNEVI